MRLEGGGGGGHHVCQARQLTAARWETGTLHLPPQGIRFLRLSLLVPAHIKVPAAAAAPASPCLPPPLPPTPPPRL